MSTILKKIKLEYLKIPKKKEKYLPLRKKGKS